MLSGIVGIGKEPKIEKKIKFRWTITPPKALKNRTMCVNVITRKGIRKKEVKVIFLKDNVRKAKVKNYQ